MTDIIAQRESLGIGQDEFPLAESEQRFFDSLFVTFSDGTDRLSKPGDARRAMLFVAVGDSAFLLIADFLLRAALLTV